jgi:hypothetical protein
VLLVDFGLLVHRRTDREEMNGFLGNLMATVVNNVSKKSADAITAMQSNNLADPFATSPLMTPELMGEFAKSGFVVVPQAVSKELRDKARRSINRSLGQGPDACPATSPFKHIPKIISSCPELMITPEITDLFRKSDAIKCVHSLVGAQVNRVWAGQIALRYPGDGCIPANAFDNTGLLGNFILNQGLKVANRQQAAAGNGEYANPNAADKEYNVMPNWHQSWHIDNWPNPLMKSEIPDGVENFTMLVGVLLSDVDGPLKGNLTVFPSAHTLLEEAIATAGGPQALFTTDPNEYQNVDAMRDPQSASLRKLMAVVQPRMPLPVQVQGRAGDIVIAHYQMAHT